MAIESALLVTVVVVLSVSSTMCSDLEIDGLDRNVKNGSEHRKQGKSLNFTKIGDQNVLSNNSSDDIDLSDVTIDENEDEDVTKILTPKMDLGNGSAHFLHGICEKGGLTYEPGERLEIDCDSICTCRNGRMDCEERCVKPLVPRGQKPDDATCSLRETEDRCCQMLVCARDTETEALEQCTYGNETFNRGETVKKDCKEFCTCSAGGKVNCKPRCPKQTKTSDRCVEIDDPSDACCKKVLCDVTLDENEPDKDFKRKITSARYINSSMILIKFDDEEDVEEENGNVIIDVSDDKKHWISYKLLPGGYLFVKSYGRWLKLDESDDVVEIQNGELGQKHAKGASKGCGYKGRSFKFGEEYNDDCSALCVCQEAGMKCLKLQCPTYFGIDVLDPDCVEWETQPKNFVAKAPNCCPEKVTCKNNGSCVYKGETFKNWDQLPINVTGCEKRCYCEMSKVECQEACPPLTALPPPHLRCPPHLASVAKSPDDDCCKQWVCNNNNNNHNLPLPPQDDIIVHTLEALDPRTVRLAFMVPRVIVGLHGRVEVKYSNVNSISSNSDTSNWHLQVFAPPSDLIATPSLEFDLQDLQPDTEYVVKITVRLRDLDTAPTSRVYKIKTPKEVHTTEKQPQSIPIEPELAVTDVNVTWVEVKWRKFTEYELQFIDGVQLRYKEVDGKVYSATPLIHRFVTGYRLEQLKPSTRYELGIDLIPFPKQLTELHAKKMLHFTTAQEVDVYGFNVTLDIVAIKSRSVEVAWSGVPYPEDKYVTIYRAIYQRSDSGKEEENTFKLAKRDSPARTVIADLKPGTRYRIWLEIYLTNGRVKTSNVKDFATKEMLAPTLSQGKLSSAPSTAQSDYYGPLVAVAILAAVAIFSALGLLVLLLRRHQNKAAITSPNSSTSSATTQRVGVVSQSAYDNPSYKMEIQQETMGL